MRHIKLESEIDLDGFRKSCRLLLAEQARPETVEWSVAGSGSESLFDDAMLVSVESEDIDGETADGTPGSTVMSGSASATTSVTASAPAPAPASASVASAALVPRAFLTLCENVILHSDRERFGLLYGLLWRLASEPDFRHDTLDPAMARARLMSQAVRRDMHKMTAFVRFRELPDPADASSLLHVAWFEPDHHIVEAIAPFFIRRFATMRWAILTPERSIRWDGSELQIGPGGTRDQAPPPDANEALWLTYYEHIFNPARLKINAMQKEMPRKYWHNLPEAALIAPLVASAESRSEAMVELGGSTMAKRMPAATRTLGASREPLNISPGKLAGDDLGAGGGGTGTADAARGGGGVSVSLDALHQAASACRECPIGEHATQVVWGEGRPHARLMVVGEQPGDQEDLQGRPFVGPSGALFNKAVADLGWSRPEIYVTNAVKHFKFEVRGRRRIHKTPSQREAATCQHWLESEIEAVQPVALIALGGTASRALMGRAVGVMSERGQWLVRDDGRKVLITLHPSALLRLQDADRDAAYAQWLDDLRKASSVAIGEDANG